MPGVSVNFFQQIGQFMAARIKEINTILSSKADKTALDALDARLTSMNAGAVDLSQFVDLSNNTYRKADVYSKVETDAQIQKVVGAAPAALDTLKESADALNNDADFSASVTNQLSEKASNQRVDTVEASLFGFGTYADFLNAYNTEIATA